MDDSSYDSWDDDWLGAPDAAAAADPAARLALLQTLVQQTRAIEAASDEASVSASSNDSENAADGTTLSAAIEAGDVAQTQRLLDGDVNVVLRLGDEPHSPMSLAAHFGHVDLLRALFQMGASLEPADDTDVTPMYAAARAGHIDAVRLLVTEMGADPNHASYIPAIVLACSHGHLPLLRYLMEDLRLELPVKDENYEPLHAAAHAGYIDVVRYLLTEHAADVNQRGVMLDTLLHCAAQGRQMAMVQMLVGEWRADVNIVDACDRSPLTNAIKAGSLELARYLVENGASTSIGYPLRAACSAGRVDVLRWLLELGLQPLDVHELVMIAAGRNGGGDVLRELVARYGCSVQTANRSGNTPLYHAVHNGADTVPVLIELGADDRAPLQMATRQTLLDCAVYCRKPQIARYLVEERGHEVTPAIFHAACRMTEAFAEWLIDSGRADWRTVPACLLARRLHQQHRRMRTEGLGSPLPVHLRDAVVALLAAGRARLPPLVLRRLADMLVRRVGRDVHAHPLSGSDERVCRGCGRRAPCRTCATCSFGLCAECAVGLE